MVVIAAHALASPHGCRLACHQPQGCRVALGWLLAEPRHTGVSNQGCGGKLLLPVLRMDTHSCHSCLRHWAGVLRAPGPGGRLLLRAVGRRAGALPGRRHVPQRHRGAPLQLPAPCLDHAAPAPAVPVPCLPPHDWAATRLLLSGAWLADNENGSILTVGFLALCTGAPL